MYFYIPVHCLLVFVFLCIYASVFAYLYCLVHTVLAGSRWAGGGQRVARSKGEQRRTKVNWKLCEASPSDFIHMQFKARPAGCLLQISNSLVGYCCLLLFKFERFCNHQHHHQYHPHIIIIKIFAIIIIIIIIIIMKVDRCSHLGGQVNCSGRAKRGWAEMFNSSN